MAVTFTRGALVAGLLAAIQDRNHPDANPIRTVRLSLQGGVALTAATMAADALGRRDYARAAIAATAGAVSLLAAETLLTPADKENDRGQEA